MEKIKIVAFVGKSGAGKNYLARDYANTCKGHIIVPSSFFWYNPHIEQMFKRGARCNRLFFM